MLEPIYIKIGKNIQNARSSKGITQDTLAKNVGLARTSIVHIENGKQRLTIDRLYKIAQSLNEPVKNLLPDDNIVKERIDDFSKNRISNTTKEEIISLIEKKIKEENNDQTKTSN